MKTIWVIVIAVVMFIAGIIAGGTVGTGVGAGLGAGVGIEIGLQAGVCHALATAEEQGFIAANQADNFISKVVEKMQMNTEPEGLSKDFVWLKNKSDCGRVLAEAKKGVSRNWLPSPTVFITDGAPICATYDEANLLSE